MSRPRVDVVVPGAEGSWIARTLREAGFDVREADDTQGSGDADAVVVDRTIAGFEDALASLRRPARIVVGWEPPTSQDAESWGTHATFTRPVPLHRLIEALGDAVGLPTAPSELGRATLPAPSSHPAPTALPPREPTVNLDPSLPPREPTVNLEASDLTTSPRADSPRAEDPRATAGRGADAPPSSSEVLSSAGVAVEFSPSIHRLLQEADRRVFPNEPALDLRFPGGDEPADVLVPDDLIAEVSMPLDLPDADPLDAFTFVGTPDLLTDGEPPDRAFIRPPSSSEQTPRTVDDRPGRPTDAAGVSASVRSGVGREGMLPRAGAVRVLWQAHDEPKPVEVRFDIPGGPTLSLAMHGGRLLSLQGPVYLRAVAMLREDQRLRAIPEDEESARALLNDEVRFGRLDAFELSSLLRRSRETLIHELVVAPEARFTMQTFTGLSADRPLIHGLVVAIACEGARQRVTTQDAFRWLAFHPHGKLVLSSTFLQRASDAGVEPELIEAFEAAAEQAVGELLAAAPALVGVAGALLTLASADAVRIEGTAESVEIQASIARERVLRAAHRAQEGSYFAILGVGTRASSREIERARQRATSELLGIDLTFLGLENLEDARREALVAIEEAAAILLNQRLREAYARALERSPLR